MRQTQLLKQLGGIVCFFVMLAPLAASGADADKAFEKPRALYLLTQQNPQDVPAARPVLARELMRQALLIAARDGLGLQTRDQSLREWSGDAPANAWNVIPSNDGVKIVIGGGPALWTNEKPKTPWWPARAVERAVEIEPLTRGAFVKLLQDNGFTGTPNVIKPGAPAPADAEAGLADFEELSQFALLRETHALIRSDGESEARLGVLVRAYANLGQLTRFHWSIEHQVFAARSLLYAQRMVANNPKSAAALWHCAYATALAGWQGEALRNLAAAKKLASDAKAPAWVGLLEPFCHYDFRKLNDVAAADAAQAPLASYLAFLTVEKCNCQMLALKTERAALDANPRCLRLIDAMCDETGPGLLNQLAEMGPQLFSTTLGEKLQKMPGLPQAAIQKIEDQRRPGGNPAGREIICQSLIEFGAAANDQSEPSWAALSRTIQETTFAHIRRKANLIAMQWGVDASGYAAEVRPLIVDHPFKGVIGAYGAFHETTNDNAAAALQSIAWGDLTIAEFPLYNLEYSVGRRKKNSGGDVLGAISRDMDMSSFDQEAWCAVYSEAIKGSYFDGIVQGLKTSSPDSPWIACNDIVNHWDPAKAQAWEQSHGGHPFILITLGEALSQRNRWKDAERCLQQYIEISPDVTGYQRLAEIYRSQHMNDRWLATLKAFLEKTEPIALEHAQVQVEIANYYMYRRQCHDALPYADAAAGTASAWGLACAARAHTGIGDYAGAEALMTDEIQHYSQSPFPWCTWCIQTGHGHRQDAFKAFHAYIDSRGGHLSQEDLMQMALISVIEGKTADAIATWNQRFVNSPGPLSLVHVVIVADETDNVAARDEALRKLADLRQGNAPTRGFARVLARAYQGPGASLDLAAVENVLQKGKFTDLIEIPLLTARYLIKHGQKEAAIGYVKRCYFDYEWYCADDILLYQTTRDLGLDPMTMEKPILPESSETRPAAEAPAAAEPAAVTLAQSRRQAIETAPTEPRTETSFKGDVKIGPSDSPKPLPYRWQKQIKITEPTTITVAAGTEIRDCVFNLGRRGHLIVQGRKGNPVIFRHVKVIQDLDASFKAEWAVFDGCRFNKGGAFYEKYSSKWTFTSCVLYNCRFPRLTEVDYGFQIRNCALISMEFPEISHPHENGFNHVDALHQEWNTIGNCDFVDCTLPPTVCWCAESSNFLGCKFISGEPFDSKKPWRHPAYVANTVGPAPQAVWESDIFEQAPVTLESAPKPFETLSLEGIDALIPELVIDKKGVSVTQSRLK